MNTEFEYKKYYLPEKAENMLLVIRDSALSLGNNKLERDFQIS